MSVWAVSFGLGWLSVPFYVLFATNCHRVILLGEDSIPHKLGLYWSSNETRFIGWIIVLGFIAFVVGVAMQIVPTVLVMFEYYETPIWYYSYFSTVIVAYFDGRLGLVLPATAIGDRMRLGDAWRRTKPVGWAIFFALIIPIVITEIADYLLFEQLLNSNSLFIYFIRTILFYPLIAIGVAVLTVAYRDIAAATNPDHTP